MASSIPKRPLRGILKTPQPEEAAASAAPPPPPRSEEETRQIALKHANIIQERKELENTILESILRLTDLPVARDPAHSSASPAARDVEEFKRLVRVFQPTDYDDLIEERNTCGLCGYTLCPKPRKQFPGNGTWKLVNAGTKDFNIVQKKELEKWCSQECARRALYIKVQLNETAAWERVGIPDINIDLLDEEPQEASEEDQLTRQVARLKLEEDRKTSQQSATLALERGDPSTKRTVDPFDIEIREKTVTSQPSEPKLQGDDDDSHTLMEGHRPKFTS
ncbi:uncharacterized protein E0L32_007330 [Thyridium curvatum]|uniref:RNA polymerase II subunit B1 CTD phosphatase RPAP2 homolog n=1 Tax=Thyridium curvatum TaxID=1093900 RepID=A0A507AX17_9PEZI|nr:uncharacterized protein E0L32_007330 [Thyridium curvatum]TPX12027.1 hypothetical protein E0L32_007330 [Thyridium curvatum]